jgi:adenine/guanine phosphoribosyltransferase-like PRPP-binding protein
MRRYFDVESDRLLIVDDVWTTGGSMEEHRAGRDAIGAVLFARGPVADWVTPLFTLNELAWKL